MTGAPRVCATCGSPCNFMGCATCQHGDDEFDARIADLGAVTLAAQRATMREELATLREENARLRGELTSAKAALSVARTAMRAALGVLGGGGA